jgi:plastocyanin
VLCMKKIFVLIGSALALATAGAAWAVANSGGVDPRSGGLQINLGEWAIGPEARAIRPGRVTLVVTNRGKQRHGLLIRSLGNDDAIGGDDDKVKTVRLEPGSRTRITLDLAPGKYVIECFVSHHDERGMYGMLDVRHDAPLVQPKPRAANSVQIKNFAYAPATLRVKAGSTVRWTNEDSAPHTASASNGSFTSPTLRLRGSYSKRFTRPGRYSYLCALHPGMRGTVVVTG